MVLLVASSSRKALLSITHHSSVFGGTLRNQIFPSGGRYAPFTCSAVQNGAARHLFTAPRLNLRNASSMAPSFRLSSKRLFASSTPPPKVGAEKVVRVVRKSEGASSKATDEPKTWFQKFIAPKEIPPRNTFAWYMEMVLICTVFAITGTSTMVLVRPAVKDVLGLEGNFKDGPWSYRICSLVIMSPIYSVLLVMVGTTFGRHAYFRHFSVKMLSRFGIPPEALDKTFHATAKNFRKY